MLGYGETFTGFLEGILVRTVQQDGGTARVAFDIARMVTESK
jgi:hypothetical protein